MDLHRHDEFSTFDGFGSAMDNAEYAKELGYDFLGITNHGNTNGLIQHYKACKEFEIKPVLGVEAYFLPVYKPQDRGDHLCVFAKNKEGYANMNRLIYAGDKQKYYNPIITFKDLNKYKDGLIVSSACVAGTLAKSIIADNIERAEKFVANMKKIFGDDFYIEIQPYKVDDKGTQEKVNVESMRIAKKFGVKCILTSDSHRARKDDFKTYLKMHEVAGHDLKWIEDTYKQRYMPTEEEFIKRFEKMHQIDFGMRTRKIANEMIQNIKEIGEKVDGDILDQLPLQLPKFDENISSEKLIEKKVKQGLLTKKKQHDKTYIRRCKEELKVINHHGLADYFLMVADYVNYAKDNGIAVGPGRGSGCNSEVNFVLGITDVDSILFNLDFRRFLRMDKLKYPDIDVDFETDRRDEVIEYLLNKYKGHSAKICSYGRYKVDNLLNDLAKVCGLPTDKTVDEEEKKINKKVIAEIKTLCKRYIDDEGTLDKSGLLSDPDAIGYNEEYDNIILHFTKLYMKVRYIGTHAAGVAITGGDLLEYTTLRTDANGNTYIAYDLNDIEKVNVIKFDILGLRTMSCIKECEQLSGVGTEKVYDWIKDEKLLQAFKDGKTDGVFQFEKKAAKEILNEINCDCFEDVIAANSMNRPVPLKMGVPEQYAKNKIDIDDAREKEWYKYTKDTYGTVIYQEHLINICIELAKMQWASVDKLMKIIKKPINEKTRPVADELKKEFVSGITKNTNMDSEEAGELFESFLAYLFNKGHATGYSMISVEEMFYKVYYPNAFWYVKIKYAGNPADYDKYCEKAVADGAVIFLPHVNYSGVKTRIRKVDGEMVIQQGLTDIKGIGESAAEYIVQERKKGIFKSYDDFYDRCAGSKVNKKVVELLKEHGASEFNKKRYITRVKKYNSALYARGM